MSRKYLACLLVIVFIIPTSAFSKPASKESIRQLLTGVGAGKMGLQVMNQMIPAMKKMMPDAPDKFWKDIIAEANANAMIELVIPVYQKYLTEEDVKGINAFYASAAGKKLIKVQPAIMRESMQIGQQWGRQLARKIFLKYKKNKHEQTLSHGKAP